MDLEAARTLAYELLDEHVHTGTYACGVWSVRWMDSRRKAGECDYATRTISLSRFWTRHGSVEQVTETIKHEIAHVLTPEYMVAHGAAWKANARSLGVKDPKATCEREASLFKWVATCPGCGKQDGMARLGSVAKAGKYVCGECVRANPTRPRADFRLDYVQQF